MQFSLVLVAAAATFVTGASIEQRDAVSPLVKDLATINDDAVALLKAAKDGDGSNALKDINIGTAAKKLEDDIDAAIAVAKKIKKSQVTEKDAKAVYDAFLKTEPTAKAICKALKADRAGFKKAGIYNVVADGVSDIPPRIKTIGGLVLKLAPKDYQSKAKALLAKYNKDLDVCIKSFPAQN